MFKFEKVIPFSIIALGVLLLAWGYLQGDALEVYEKGTRICLECIGLGR